MVDCGDEIHGTGVAQWTQGAAIVPALKALGIDAMTPGNWEFGFGPEILRSRVAEMEFPVLGCNVSQADTNLPAFGSSLIREVAGIRVGLLGVTSPIVVERMPKHFGQGLRFADPVEVLPRHIHELREKDKVDLVVLISHMGLPQDMKLAEAVPGIDVVLSSHTHDRLARPLIVGKTLIIQSGFSGSFLGRLRVEVAKGQVCAFEHELIEVAESTEPDPTVQAIVDEQVGPHRDRLDEVVGATASPLHRMSVLESPMDNLITDSYVSLTGADVSFSHGWRYGAPVVAGDITQGDLWQIIPTNPEVFTARMTGEDIRKTLEASLESVYASSPFHQKGGYPIRVSGLSAIVRINNPKGARVQQLDIGGNPYRADRLYTVAGAGEQDLSLADEKKGTGVAAIDAIKRHLTSGSPVHPEVTHGKFIAI
jgi:2',3'-cyclic-nucleotide 2'-phosphodiesterase (5'-nucleotidase family)